MICQADLTESERKCKNTALGSDIYSLTQADEFISELRTTNYEMQKKQIPFVFLHFVVRSSQFDEYLGLRPCPNKAFPFFLDFL